MEEFKNMEYLSYLGLMYKIMLKMVLPPLEKKEKLALKEIKQKKNLLKKNKEKIIDIVKKLEKKQQLQIWLLMTLLTLTQLQQKLPLNIMLLQQLLQKKTPDLPTDFLPLNTESCYQKSVNLN